MVNCQPTRGLETASFPTVQRHIALLIGLVVAACTEPSDPAMNGERDAALAPRDAGLERDSGRKSDAGNATVDAATQMLRDGGDASSPKAHDAGLVLDASARSTLDAGEGGSDASDGDASDRDASDRDASARDAGAKTDTDLEDAGSRDASAHAELHDEAMFIDLEARTIELEGEGVVVPSARMFTSLLVADEQPESAPLFVLFNGGPGTPTSTQLLVQGTARVRLDPDDLGAGPIPNPASWTQLGNLLYIDPRQAGFSYQASTEALSEELVLAESQLSAFHYKTDGADLLRVVLRFLKAHPALQDNPVILVGESYGGFRSALMLSFLLTPERLDLEDYRDLALREEILTHFAAIGGSADRVDPEFVSRQFGHQILIQPAFSLNELDAGVALTCAPGAFAKELADGLGEECPAASRDPYDQGRPASYEDELVIAASLAITTPDVADLFFGVDLRSVVGMSSAERVGAYRAPERSDSTISAQWLGTQGALSEFDAYHTALRSTGSGTWMTSLAARAAFGPTLQWVHTFITNAGRDAVVNTEVLPEFIGWHSAWISGVRLDREPRPGVERSGWIAVDFNADSPIGVATREIRWPRYERAGHAVSNNCGQELFDDVAEFMAATP